ncbi:hypothetical protein V494_06044 [Pseudogymnoascus sp. VKM F-4513 (FW-928)]|nr:hypothetical protein V494_06044 [Pseudogymnoascus sp. VKM F-4513 (FW-928)]
MQEQQYQTRLLLERQEQDGGERGSLEEQDHQMHLMLLEQQNKQRLLISRRQQEYSERGIPLELSGAVFDLRDAEQEETDDGLAITGQKLSWGSEAAHYIAKARQEYDTARGSEAAAGSTSLPQVPGEHIVAEPPVTAEEHTAPGISS